MALIEFSKMHGLGNDFVMIDAINQAIDLSSEQVKFLCDRHFGIGCDQLLLVEKSQLEGVDFKYRIYNQDGGEVEQCGNGARCFARFVQIKGLSSKNPIRVETTNAINQLLIEGDKVCVDMGTPNFNIENLPLAPEYCQQLNEHQFSLILEWQGQQYPINFYPVSIGNPHISVFVDDIEKFPVNPLGKILESHLCFPKRTNVGFVEIVSQDHIKLRVYERGCGETLACGSGACAAVANGILQNKLTNKVLVDLRGGQLELEWDGEGTPIWMRGTADFVFEGQINL